MSEAEAKNIREGDTVRVQTVDGVREARVRRVIRKTELVCDIDGVQILRVDATQAA